MLKCNEIQNRHSCRCYYKEKKIPQEIINTLIMAASLAPTGKNIQPWRFRIITDENVISGLANYLPNNKWILTAPCLVIVYLDTNESYSLEKDTMAIGAAIENILLEAESNGISSCWLGECLEKADTINRYLGSMEKVKLMAVITLGYERRKMIRAAKKSIHDLILE